MLRLLSKKVGKQRKHEESVFEGGYCQLNRSTAYVLIK
jgi:hypothetical protein